jgi:hypothetical protein
MGETSGKQSGIPSAKLRESGALKIFLEFFEHSQTLKVYLYVSDGKPRFL